MPNRIEIYIFAFNQTTINLMRPLYLPLVFLLMMLATLGVQAQDAFDSSAEVEPTECRRLIVPIASYDFGTIREQDGEVSHTFTLRNVSSDTLRIGRYELGCDCTDLTYSNKEILPQGETSITVMYNPTYRPGKFSREVNIFLLPETEYVTLGFQGKVKKSPYEDDYEVSHALGRGLYVSQQRLHLLDKGVGEERQFLLTAKNQTRRPITVHFETEACKQAGVTVKVEETVTIPAQAKVSIPIAVAQPSSHEGWIDLPLTVGGKVVKPLHVTWFTTLIP